MDWLTKNNSIKGFSLIELMVVLSIISIVSGLAYPRYLQMKIRAGQLEAIQNLNHIYTLQVAFQSENDSYGILDFVGSLGSELDQCDTRASSLVNDIGFHFTDACKLRYVYASRINNDRYNNNTNCGDNCFTAFATNEHNDWNGSSARFGRGFGIPLASCSPWPNAIGWYDAKIVNQDKEIGHFGEGVGHTDIANALNQCK